jgi:hypothetical protein
MRAVVLASLALLLLSGCLQRQLRAPVEDHRVQTTTIAKRCAEGEYGSCSTDLREDLEAMARQAELLDNIVKGQAPK